ncbi:unnamed protein product [Phytomonas sp. EM1]|nr:unnamed protein product [Phytomonas sp. EM1]|eukprot:CCW61709.1 unnamed protein product [Phytomonas sp. isolate EM1]
MSRWPHVILLLVLLSTSVSAHTERRRSIAGWVEADPEIIPYVTVRVVDGRAGIIVRTASLDVTNTFSFIGLPDTVKEVQVLVELFDPLYRLNTADSVLSLPLDNSKPLHFKVAVEKVAQDSLSTATSWEADRCVLALATLFAIVCMWVTRYSLISFIDSHPFKLPEAKRTLVMR